MVEPIAGVIGAALVIHVQMLLPFALAFAAGAMILVAVHELIPECQQNQKANPYIATMGIVFGFALMMLLDVALVDRNDYHLDRSQLWRQYQTVIIAVNHNEVEDSCEFGLIIVIT